MMRGMVAAMLMLLLGAVPADILAAGVEVGMKAPDFEAESTKGTVRLSDYAGKKNVLLAVYYKDFTSG